jgi:hypothetical protein
MNSPKYSMPELALYIGVSYDKLARLVRNSKQKPPESNFTASKRTSGKMAARSRVILYDKDAFLKWYKNYCGTSEKP